MPARAVVKSRVCIGLVVGGGLGAIAVILAGFGSGPNGLMSFAGGEAVASQLLIWAVLFVAAVISSTVGFAFSAIAAGLVLHLVSGAMEAVQTLMLTSIGIQFYSVGVLWRSIQWSRCLPFITGGIAALPLGILLLQLAQQAYAFVIGAALVAYASYMLLRRPVAVVVGERPLLDAAVGALGGITGPLAAMPGVCMAIWCGMRGWDKIAQRAMYQPYILIMQLIALTLLCLQQRQPLDPVLLTYVLAGFAGAILGMRIFASLTDVHFQRLINVALILSGLALVFK